MHSIANDNYRYNIHHRQPKVPEWQRIPEGQLHREVSTCPGHQIARKQLPVSVPLLVLLVAMLSDHIPMGPVWISEYRDTRISQVCLTLHYIEINDRFRSIEVS